LGAVTSNSLRASSIRALPNRSILTARDVEEGLRVEEGDVGRVNARGDSGQK